MAVTVAGVQGYILDVDWSQMFADMMTIGAQEGVAAGLSCSPTAGSSTRGISVTAGRSVQAGTLLRSTTTQLVNAQPNGTTNPRLDLVCAQVDWTQPIATAGSIVVVQGVAQATPLAPTPIRIPGTKWQTPLALAPVPAGATALSNIVNLRGKADAPQYGQTQIVPVPNVPTKTTITFPRPFSVAPIVLVTPYTSVPGTTVLGVGAYDITATGFELYLTRTNTTTTLLNWAAALAS